MLEYLLGGASCSRNVDGVQLSMLRILVGLLRARFVHATTWPSQLSRVGFRSTWDGFHGAEVMTSASAVASVEPNLSVSRSSNPCP